MVDKEKFDYYRKNFKNVIHNDDCSAISKFPVAKNTLTDLLWPCVLYRVEVQSAYMRLDIFEKTILGLAECKITATSDVSSQMKMSPEIIEFIQNRLVQKGLLENRTFKITENGLGSLEEVSNGNAEPIVVCVLKDLISGKLLDYAEENPPLNSIKGIFTDNEITYAIYFLPGNENRKENLVFPKETDLEINAQSEPAAALILRAIRKFNKSAEENKRIPLSENSNRAEIKSEEMIFVHTKAFATTSALIFSTDAAGLEISDIYTDFIRKADTKQNPWLKQIFERGQIKSDEKNTEENDKTPEFKFPAISRLLFNINKKLNNIKNIEAKSGLPEREEIQRNGEQIIYDLFSTFEEILKFYYQNNHNENYEDSEIYAADAEARRYNKEMAEMTDSNTILYYPLAEKLGFELSGQEKQQLKVLHGKIKSMRRGEQSEFAPLLCLALAYANAQKETPLDYLCEKCPDFISRLLLLKELRDKTHIAHGPGLKANDVKYDAVKKFVEQIRNYTLFLCPELESDIKTIFNYTENSDDFKNHAESHRKRFNAKMELYKTFGNSTINSLNSNIVNQMINLEMSFEEKRHIIGIICSVLQQTFEQAIVSISRIRNPPPKENRNSNFAAQKCENAGFSLPKNELPETLKTVNKKRINKAVCGKCETFGAAVLAFIILAEETELKDIASRFPNMLLEIDNLLKLRGHKDVKEYSKEEVSTFKEIYTYIMKEIINFIE